MSNTQGYSSREGMHHLFLPRRLGIDNTLVTFVLSAWLETFIPDSYLSIEPIFMDLTQSFDVKEIQVCFGIQVNLGLS